MSILRNKIDSRTSSACPVLQRAIERERAKRERLEARRPAFHRELQRRLSIGVNLPPRSCDPRDSKALIETLMAGMSFRELREMAAMHFSCCGPSYNDRDTDTPEEQAAWREIYFATCAREGEEE